MTSETARGPGTNAVLGPDTETFADLLARLGDISPERVLVRPPPGTAKEADVIVALEAPRKRICELIDGVLVEKTSGLRESVLTVHLATFLGTFMRPDNLGVLTGPDGTIALWPGRVRIPDISFYSWDRLPGRRLPEESLPTLAPDLAVEILSRSNTPQEMLLKRQDYFRVGVRLVWEVDPEKRTVAVYTAPETPPATLTEADTLVGGSVLPGFTLPLRDLFAELDRRG